MDSCFVWVAQNEQTFQCIIGVILSFLLVLYFVVGFSEKKRLSGEQEARGKYENDRIKKLRYVQDHMDVFGINGQLPATEVACLQTR